MLQINTACQPGFSFRVTYFLLKVKATITQGVFFSQGGMYILQLMDHYVASWSLLIVGLTEVLVISYVYGQYCPSKLQVTCLTRTFYSAIKWHLQYERITFDRVFLLVKYLAEHISASYTKTIYECQQIKSEITRFKLTC